MTLASALYGGGGGIKYRAGNLYMAFIDDTVVNGSVPNIDCIIPFSPRVNMTLDRVAWYRDNTNAGNVRVGLYSSAGTLLTDCALDNNTTEGWHLVDTTNVALTGGEFYWLCWNASADVAATQLYSTSANSLTREMHFQQVEKFGMAVGIGTSEFDSHRGVAQQKSRTNAALLASLTMSGFTFTSLIPVMGVIPA